MPPQSRKSELLALAVILFIAAFFRFAFLDSIPPGLYPDEAANGNNALEAIRTGNFKVFYPENNGREGLFINLQALAVALLGANPWTLRAVSALFGTLTVLGLYLATRELLRELDKKSHIALLSSFFLATSFWHINFSRIGFRAIMLPLFSVFALYWLLKASRTGKITSAVAAGVSTGLGLSTYIGFRFMPFVLVVPMILQLRAWLRNKAGTCVPCVLAVFLSAALIAALPMGLHFMKHPEDFTGRSAQVSVFSTKSPAAEFIKSNILTLGMFNIRGDCNPRHNLECRPQLFWPVGIIFITGLAVVIRSLFKNPLPPQACILMAWFFLMMLPATLTREGLPHALRSIGMLPPVMILAGIGGIAVWQWLKAYSERLLTNQVHVRYQVRLRRTKKELAVAAALFLIWLPVQTHRDYFTRFAYAPETAGAFSTDLWERGLTLRNLPLETKKFVIVNLSGENIRGIPAPAQTVMFASDTFDDERRLQMNVSYITKITDIVIDSSAKIVIMPLNLEDAGLNKALLGRFPGIRARNIGNAIIFEN